MPKSIYREDWGISIMDGPSSSLFLLLLFLDSRKIKFFFILQGGVCLSSKQGWRLSDGAFSFIHQIFTKGIGLEAEWTQLINHQLGKTGYRRGLWGMTLTCLQPPLPFRNYLPSTTQDKMRKWCFLKFTAIVKQHTHTHTHFKERQHDNLLCVWILC